MSNDQVSGVVVSRGRSDLLQGTLDLLVLQALQARPFHGWAISKRIQQMSKDALTVNQGSLYPALYRLEDRGWIAGAEGVRRGPSHQAVPVDRRRPAAARRRARHRGSTFSAAINHVIKAGADDASISVPVGCGGFACSSAGTRSSGRWTPRCVITSSARRRSTSGMAWRRTRRGGGRCAISAASSGQGGRAGRARRPVARGSRPRSALLGAPASPQRAVHDRRGPDVRARHRRRQRHLQRRLRHPVAGRCRTRTPIGSSCCGNATCRGTEDQNVVSVENFEAWRDSARVIRRDGRAGAASGHARRRRHARARHRRGVSPGYFALLGVDPVHGREFAVPMRGPAPRVVILSDGFWRRRFAGDPSVVGRVLSISGQPHTIVGVMPNDRAATLRLAAASNSCGFRSCRRPRIAPGAGSSWSSRGCGRTSRSTAPAPRWRRLRSGDRGRFPANKGWQATVTPLAQQITGDVRTPLVVLLCAVGPAAPDGGDQCRDADAVA